MLREVTAVGDEQLELIDRSAVSLLHVALTRAARGESAAAAALASETAGRVDARGLALEELQSPSSACAPGPS